MVYCVQAVHESCSPYDCWKELEKWKRLENPQGSIADHMREDVRKVMRLKPEDLYKDHQPCLPEGPEPEAKKGEPLGESVSCRSPKVKRILRSKRRTTFKPADEARGSQGAGPVESKSEPPRGTSYISPESVTEVLRTSNQLLQAALQLLQGGPECQGSQGKEKQGEKVERGTNGVDAVGVACQTDPEKRSVVCQTVPERWNVAC